MSDFILYIVVRESLHMSPGKVSAQSVHAIRLMSETPAWMSDNFVGWRQSPTCKVVVLQSDDKDWEKLKILPESPVVVRDLGLTEVVPGTETVMVFPPMVKEVVPKLIRRLRLLS